VQTTPLRCLSCHHEWIGELVMDAPANVVIASMRVLRCPNCGAGWKRVVLRRVEP
jgi:DNA-directed RNA polymerase subunit RPC12/RpoP